MATETAYEWGVRHNSCAPALKQRVRYATQADWWRACKRGDWLIWQLRHGLTVDELRAVLPALLRAIERIVARAVETHALHCGVAEVEGWAAQWLAGDETAVSASVSAWAAASVVTDAAAAAWTAASVSASVSAWAAASVVTDAAAAAWTAASVSAAAEAAAEAAAAAAAWAAAAAAAEAAVEAAVAAWAAAAAEAEAAVAAAVAAADIHAEIPDWPGR